VDRLTLLQKIAANPSGRPLVISFIRSELGTILAEVGGQAAVRDIVATLGLHCSTESELVDVSPSSIFKSKCALHFWRKYICTTRHFILDSKLYQWECWKSAWSTAGPQQSLGSYPEKYWMDVFLLRANEELAWECHDSKQLLIKYWPSLNWLFSFPSQLYRKNKKE
jgi:hypothetical protein